MFTKVLELCQAADLVKLGHVALDGTKVKANASKHKAMSYGRMKKKASELEAEVRLLAQPKRLMRPKTRFMARAIVATNPPKDGSSKGRLEKIRAAMAEIEAEAQAEYAVKKAAYEEKLKKRKHRKRPGPKPRPPSEEPESKKQRNFTDPDSRIMVDSGTFVQAYNCQAAVDEKAQIILAADVQRKRQEPGRTDGRADQETYRQKPKVPDRLRIPQSRPDQAAPQRHRRLHCHQETQTLRSHPQVSTGQDTKKRNGKRQNGQKATYDQRTMHLLKEKAGR